MYIKIRKALFKVPVLFALDIMDTIAQKCE